MPSTIVIRNQVLSPQLLSAGSDASDSELLAQFYSSVQGIGETLEHWHALDEPLDNYNIWNVLMQRVQQSIRLGRAGHY